MIKYIVPFLIGILVFIITKILWKNIRENGVKETPLRKIITWVFHRLAVTGFMFFSIVLILSLTMEFPLVLRADTENVKFALFLNLPFWMEYPFSALYIILSLMLWIFMGRIRAEWPGEHDRVLFREIIRRMKEGKMKTGDYYRARALAGKNREMLKELQDVCNLFPVLAGGRQNE